MNDTKFYLANYEVPKTFELVEQLVVAQSEEQAIEFVSREGVLKCIRELSPFGPQASLLRSLR